MVARRRRTERQTQPRAAPPAPQSGPQSGIVPIAGLAIEIAGKALAGKNRFEIRLDPPELGRIDVRLDVDRDGNVTSRLTVERADTYDLLRRDAAGLERALQDAGLKTADNGLQFSLRDQSANQQQTNGADTAQTCRAGRNAADNRRYRHRSIAASPDTAAVSIFASEDQA